VDLEAAPRPNDRTGTAGADRAWEKPRMRRLATSEAENSTGIGPDAETVAS
jgi:hypothetical protein